jgi:hypothetical protein
MDFELAFIFFINEGKKDPESFAVNRKTGDNHNIPAHRLVLY